MLFSGATVPGKATGANEDWASVTSDLLVVLDGATVRTDTGCKHGVAWYARKLGAGIIAEAASKSHPLTEVLATAIAEVAALHSESCDLSHPGTPSAAVAMVRLEGETLRYAVLGDVTVVLETADEIITVSDDRISKSAVAERRIADQYPIGDPRKGDAMVKMKHIELAARNTPDGYWIAATEPSAAHHALTGELDRALVRRIAVMSDGAARAVDMFGLHSWHSALDHIESFGPDSLIRQVRETEQADSRGELYRRNKKSDDATIVFACSENRVKGMMMNEDRAVTRPTVSADERQRMIAATLAAFQNNPNLMGEQIRPARPVVDHPEGDTPVS